MPDKMTELKPEQYVKFPIKFDKMGGMFFDEDNKHILDIRGWGHIQYHPNPEAIQDGIGEWIADAMNEKWNRRAV